MADRKLVIGVSVTTGNSVQELEKIRDAAVRFGKDGEANAELLAKQLQNVENGAEKVAKKISQGRAVTVADTGAMAQSFAQLERVIKEAFGSLENAPQEIQAAFRQAEQQVDAVRSEVVQANKAIDDNRKVTNEAGASWQGLGRSVEDAAGKHGAMIAKAGLLTAAWKEGWDIGMKLNQFFGTDMAMWNEFVSNFASRCNVIIRSLADNIVGTFSIIKEAVTLNFTEAGKKMDELAQTNAQSQKNIRAALTMSNAEWNKYAASIGVVSDEQRKAQEEAKKLAEEKAKLAEKVQEVVTALQAETAELEKQKIVAQDSALRVVDRADQLGYYKRQLDEATASLREQQAEVANLTARYGAQDPVTKAAVSELENLQNSLAYAQQRYVETSAEVKRYEEQQRSAERAIEQSRDRIEDLNAKQAELQGGTAAVATATQQAATATERHGEAAAKAAPAIKILRDEAGKITIITENIATAAKKAADNTAALATNMAPLAAAADPAVASTGKLRDNLDAISTVMEIIINRTPVLTAAIKSIGDVSSEAAGADADINPFLNTSEGA